MSHYKKILVVYNNAITHQIIVRAIKRFYGERADIYSANNGDHAKKIFDLHNSEDSPFELVITQYSTGETNGVTLAEYVAEKSAGRCRTIIYTAMPRAMLPRGYNGTALYVHKNVFDRSLLGNMFSAIEDSKAA